jgi:Predicted acetyltransferases and hydrolases with the alpha/beta hydrolase fold
MEAEAAVKITGFLRSLRAGVGRVAEAVQSFPDANARYLSVLNGVVGDSLEAFKSELAISMTMRGEPGAKTCVLVHGLCDSEKTWEFEEDPLLDYGTMLQRELDYHPVYLRYNSGLHISTNGRRLAQQLNELVESSAEPIEEMIFIAHSMGGLVVRSACHYGQQSGDAWVKRVKKIFFLGTPHLGSDWEKLGNLTSAVLRLIPTLFTWGIAFLGNKRSAGIKDLRFGYLVDEDWAEHDSDLLWKDNRHPVPLLEGVDYFLIGGTLAKKDGNFFTEYFGDGLVPPRSAHGRSYFKSKCLAFLPENSAMLRGLSHSRLARHPEVYQQILRWCQAEPRRARSNPRRTRKPSRTSGASSRR